MALDLLVTGLYSPGPCVYDGHHPGLPHLIFFKETASRIVPKYRISLVIAEVKHSM
jgi:hypothetical protein